MLDLTWLRANAKPIRTAEAVDDFSDLEPLRQMIGNAHVVALGEDSHGTHEFFTMKHRLVRFLVEQMGFTTFAMEATWAGSNRVNDFVLGAPGDPNVLLSNLRFWTWNTQEVADMLTWMRAHNANAPAGSRVNFYGFDMQFSRVTMNDVDAYLATFDTAARRIERAQYACFRQYQDSIGYANPKYTTGGGSCRSGVDSVYRIIVSSAARFVALSGQPAYDRALRAARIVAQNERFLCCSNPSSDRDAYMAENAEWLLNQAGPNAKIILWAHNGHINVATNAMGSYLRQSHGSDYVPLGFTMNTGFYNTMDWQIQSCRRRFARSRSRSRGSGRTSISLLIWDCGAFSSIFVRQRSFRRALPARGFKGRLAIESSTRHTPQIRCTTRPSPCRSRSCSIS